MTTPNAELAYAVLDHIDAHPEQWHQGRWAATSECGTVGCFAGWACMLSGDHPLIDHEDDDEAENVLTESGDRTWIPYRAAALLNMSPDGGSLSVGGCRLFEAENTREDLGRLVAEIFGPRPGATS